MTGLLEALRRIRRQATSSCRTGCRSCLPCRCHGNNPDPGCTPYYRGCTGSGHRSGCSTRDSRPSLCCRNHLRPCNGTRLPAAYASCRSSSSCPSWNPGSHSSSTGGPCRTSRLTGDSPRPGHRLLLPTPGQPWQAKPAPIQRRSYLAARSDGPSGPPSSAPGYQTGTHPCWFSSSLMRRSAAPIHQARTPHRRYTQAITCQRPGRFHAFRHG